MKLYGRKDLKAISGDMMMIYGEPGVGKSVSLMQTCPEPILYLMTEGRDVGKMLLAAERPNVKIHFGFYENWPDFIEFFANSANFEPYKTVVIDSLSHLMSINLNDEILDESYAAMERKGKGEKELSARVKLSMEGYGALSGQMLRLTNLATNLTRNGKVVICVARLENNPKFNRELAGAPALKGQEYSKNLAGFFDLIGYVEPRIEEGKIVYPPLVSFESDGGYMAKWTGKTPKGGTSKIVLNIENILREAHGQEG